MMAPPKAMSHGLTGAAAGAGAALTGMSAAAARPVDSKSAAVTDRASLFIACPLNRPEWRQERYENLTMTRLNNSAYQPDKVKASANAAFLGENRRWKNDCKGPLQIGHKIPHRQGIAMRWNPQQVILADGEWGFPGRRKRVGPA